MSGEGSSRVQVGILLVQGSTSRLWGGGGAHLLCQVTLKKSLKQVFRESLKEEHYFF